MKLCYALCMAGWFMHAVLGESYESTFKELENAETPELEERGYYEPMEERGYYEPMEERGYYEPMEQRGYYDDMGRAQNAEGTVVNPSGRFWEDGISIMAEHAIEDASNARGRIPPTPPATDACGSTSDNDFSRWNSDTVLHIPNGVSNSACGPYTTTFSEADDCPFMCGRFGLTYQACHEKCRVTQNCTAFNWSGRGDLGCVLRACGGGHVKYPTGQTNPDDWYSWSFESARGVECHTEFGQPWDILGTGI